MGIAEKAAASGLSFTHLLLSFQRGGSEALFNEKACVTGRKANQKSKLKTDRVVVTLHDLYLFQVNLTVFPADKFNIKCMKNVVFSIFFLL